MSILDDYFGDSVPKHSWSARFFCGRVSGIRVAAQLSARFTQKDGRNAQIHFCIRSVFVLCVPPLNWRRAPPRPDPQPPSGYGGDSGRLPV